jgi:hypothetical protein
VDVTALAEELRRATQRRLPEVFKDPSQQDDKRFPILSSIVSLVEPGLWTEDHTRALLVVIRRAVKTLPDALPRKDRAAWRCQITWREIGSILCGLDGNIPARVDGLPHTYSTYTNEVRSRGGLTQMPSSSFGTYVTSPLRNLLATKLIELTKHGNTYDIDNANKRLRIVRRDAYIDDICQQIEQGIRTVVIWGEPGTGKTTLASHAAHAARRGRVLTVRLGNDDVMWQDLVAVPVAIGESPESWTKAYCQMWFRRFLESETHEFVVVIDNVANDGVLDQLIPIVPRIPIILTSRHRLATQGYHVELSDLTTGQATTYLTDNIPSCREKDARALARALGNRVLALEHAVLFIRESAGLDVLMLSNVINRSIVGGIDLIEPPSFSGESRNLNVLYRLIIESLMPDGRVLSLLDAFLTMTGVSATTKIGLLAYIVEAMNEGMGPAEFRSCVRRLAAYGILREENSVLSMHMLTHSLMRQLRIDDIAVYEQRLVDYVLSFDESQAPPSNYRYHMSTLKCHALSGAHPEAGWNYLIPLDGCTWLAVRVIDGKRLLIRYEEDPDAMTTWAQSSVRERYEVGIEELHEFWRVTEKYGLLSVAIYRYQLKLNGPDANDLKILSSIGSFVREPKTVEEINERNYLLDLIAGVRLRRLGYRPQNP